MDRFEIDDENGHLVARVNTNPNGKNSAELEELKATNPGNGQGKNLMQKFLQYCSTNKIKTIAVTAVPNDEKREDDLIRFYKNFGFKSNPYDPQLMTKR